ncbi:hypothetical protein [Paraburkholderia sp. BL23I1N1]|uniref:hypothetical protein n=1 Tax=Paraburkholderia sp. BL23I1N1 TaxID=1938802 RepID=UPI000E762904|nr:hypothetical protein [Paraburkholderia sp. BL23I1N1]
MDNSEQLPPLPREDENCNDAAPPERDASAKAEAAIVELLQSLETARGKTPAFDGSKARIHVLAWIGRCVTLEQLRTAHGFAVAARLRDKSDLPVNAGFLATFVDELLVGKSSVMPDALPWYRSDERVAIRAREIGFRDRKPNESPAWYRVLVIKAANDRKAAEFVLLDAKQFNALDLYQFARATFGDALMPVDDYAS